MTFSEISISNEINRKNYNCIMTKKSDLRNILKIIKSAIFYETITKYEYYRSLIYSMIFLFINGSSQSILVKIYTIFYKVENNPLKIFLISILYNFIFVVFITIVSNIIIGTPIEDIALASSISITYVPFFVYLSLLFEKSSFLLMTCNSFLMTFYLFNYAICYAESSKLLNFICFMITSTTLIMFYNTTFITILQRLIKNKVYEYLS